ncbi:MAG: hypothetical protein AAF799_02020 [Myxococcota bacterium]
MRRSSCLALAALACTLAAPAVASAAPAEEADTSEEETSRRERINPNRVRSIELQGVGMTQLLPRPSGGGEVAFSFGFPAFQARVGMQVLGVAPFNVGEAKVSNTLGAATLDLCAAKKVLRHQIRMCVGGQGGGMLHRWSNTDRPGRRATPWGAGTLKGDYQLELTDHFGIIGGVGVVMPLLGPTFRGRDANGSPTPQVFPGPMAGFLSLGTTFRW